MKDERQAIPAALNLVITVLAWFIATWSLWLCAHAEEWWSRLAAILAFSFVGNTIFSLMHEAVHGHLHPRGWLNDLLGILHGLWFPTSFRLQQAAHLGHHRRNRSDVELFEAYTEGDNRLLKWVQLYVILTGLYWASAPLACLALLLFPWLLRSPLLRSERAKQMSGDAMLGDIEAAWGWRMAGEIILAIAFQISLFMLLNLSWWSWLLCYGAFALNWSSLQYADHAYSPRDVIDGAWNLRVTAPVRWIFLNYHHHLAHHQYPGSPWIHLGSLIDRTAERPTFWRIYLRMWRGPIPTETGQPHSLASPETR